MFTQNLEAVGERFTVFLGRKSASEVFAKNKIKKKDFLSLFQTQNFPIYIRTQVMNIIFWGNVSFRNKCLMTDFHTVFHVLPF